MSWPPRDGMKIEMALDRKKVPHPCFKQITMHGRSAFRAADIIWTTQGRFHRINSSMLYSCAVFLFFVPLQSCLYNLLQCNSSVFLAFSSSLLNGQARRNSTTYLAFESKSSIYVYEILICAVSHSSLKSFQQIVSLEEKKKIWMEMVNVTLVWCKEHSHVLTSQLSLLASRCVFWC